MFGVVVDLCYVIFVFELIIGDIMLSLFLFFDLRCLGCGCRLVSASTWLLMLMLRASVTRLHDDDDDDDGRGRSVGRSVGD